ncbi:centromere protein e [Anaeramoeba ignava]|uniref:Centromere protein e n=1 Tax=Anaeramoeba ignava TaxID=1746090 RepID=A0A9Q0LXR1_ANAIG|nr:centromere protein e [Anaeramoeba ignava]
MRIKYRPVRSATKKETTQTSSTQFNPSLSLSFLVNHSPRNSWNNSRNNIILETWDQQIDKSSIEHDEHKFNKARQKFIPHNYDTSQMSKIQILILDAILKYRGSCPFEYIFQHVKQHWKILGSKLPEYSGYIWQATYIHLNGLNNNLVFFVPDPSLQDHYLIGKIPLKQLRKENPNLKNPEFTQFQEHLLQKFEKDLQQFDPENEKDEQNTNQTEKMESEDDTDDENEENESDNQTNENSKKTNTTSEENNEMMIEPINSNIPKTPISLLQVLVLFYLGKHHPKYINDISNWVKPIFERYSNLPVSPHFNDKILELLTQPKRQFFKKIGQTNEVFSLSQKGKNVAELLFSNPSLIKCYLPNGKKITADQISFHNEKEEDDYEEQDNETNEKKESKEKNVKNVNSNQKRKVKRKMRSDEEEQNESTLNKPTELQIEIVKSIDSRGGFATLEDIYKDLSPKWKQIHKKNGNLYSADCKKSILTCLQNSLFEQTQDEKWYVTDKRKEFKEYF